jgi:hypothetical protein
VREREQAPAAHTLAGEQKTRQKNTATTSLLLTADFLNQLTLSFSRKKEKFNLNTELLRRRNEIGFNFSSVQAFYLAQVFLNWPIRRHRDAF